jgi:hypothetical protein
MNANTARVAIVFHIMCSLLRCMYYVLNAFLRQALLHLSSSDC